MQRKVPHTTTVLALMEIWREQCITGPEQKLLVKMVCGNEMTQDELNEQIKMRVKTRSN